MIHMSKCNIRFDINFSADGHCLVWGAPGTGKTTFLQTVIMSAAKTYTQWI